MALTLTSESPSPKYQALKTIGEFPLGTDVFVKVTCEPTQTDKGVAVKLAIGVCPKLKKTENKREKKHSFFIQL